MRLEARGGHRSNDLGEGRVARCGRGADRSLEEARAAAPTCVSSASSPQPFQRRMRPSCPNGGVAPVLRAVHRRSRESGRVARLR